MSDALVLEIETGKDNRSLIIRFDTKGFLVRLSPGQEFGIDVDGRRIHTFGANEEAEEDGK